MPLEFMIAKTKREIAWCAHIRTIVFVVGQNCAPEIEIDEHEDHCRHILGFDAGRPCATARWRIYQPGIAKIERVAVLDSWRGKGIGLQLMRSVMTDISEANPDIALLRLSSQDYAIPFYEKLGFEVRGDGYSEAGIPHHLMERVAPDLKPS